jgi:chemotaxis signal transduction protein
VLEIMALPEVEPPPVAICSERVAEYLEGIAKCGDRVILLLSSEKLLTKSELEGAEAASKPGGSTKSRPKKGS